MLKYYELVDDRRSLSRWQLGGPLDESGREIDPWQFREGEFLHFDHALRFPLDETGDALDFSWAAFAIPVVHDRFAQLFQRLRVTDVQFIPARIATHKSTCWVLNALRIIRCIDDARCTEVKYWKPEHNQPDKLGQYRSVVGLRIDPSKVGNARIFRTWGWRIALIVSEDIKQAIESEGLNGARFVEV
jgi:hypothetical protein